MPTTTSWACLGCSRGSIRGPWPNLIDGAIAPQAGPLPAKRADEPGGALTGGPDRGLDAHHQTAAGPWREAIDMSRVELPKLVSEMTPLERAIFDAGLQLGRISAN